jgi:hypothetical protein
MADVMVNPGADDAALPTGTVAKLADISADLRERFSREWEQSDLMRTMPLPGFIYPPPSLERVYREQAAQALLNAAQAQLAAVDRIAYFVPYEPEVLAGFDERQRLRLVQHAQQVTAAADQRTNMEEALAASAIHAMRLDYPDVPLEDLLAAVMEEAADQFASGRRVYC